MQRNKSFLKYLLPSVGFVEFTPVFTVLYPHFSLLGPIVTHLLSFLPWMVASLKRDSACFCHIWVQPETGGQGPDENPGDFHLRMLSPWGKVGSLVWL